MKGKNDSIIIGTGTLTRPQIKKYEVRNGGDLQAIAAAIMEHEKDGWTFVEVLTQPFVVKPNPLDIQKKPAKVVTAFYPLMYKMVDVSSPVIT